MEPKMPTQTFDPKDFYKLFQAEQEENPQNAEVGEFLSGQAQHLKSADQSIVYKNYNGGDIEETHLLQNAYNQNIQTNQTDTYDVGVSTNLTETAPDIHIQHTLSNAIVQKTNALNLNRTTQDERETYHQPNVERYHESLQQNMPTELDQTIQQSGSSTINNLQQDINKQNIQSNLYKQQFQKYNHKGPIRVNGNVSFGTHSLIIGYNATEEMQDGLNPASWSAHKRRVNLIPKIHHTFTSNTVKLPTAYNGDWMVQIEITVKGDCDLDNTSSIHPLVQGRAQSEMVMKTIDDVVNDFFKNLQVKNGNVTATLGVDGTAPTFTVANKYGEYTVTDGVSLKLHAPGVIAFKYTNGVSVEKKPCDDWLVTLSGNMETTVTIKARSQGDEAEMAANNLLDRAIEYYLSLQPEIGLQVPTRSLIGATPIVNNVYQNLGNFIHQFEEILVTYSPDPATMTGAVDSSENAIVTEAIPL